MGGFDQKNQISYEFFYRKTKMIQEGLLTFFHVKKSDYKNIKRFLSYTQKCMKKRHKTGYRRNAIISKPRKIY